MRGRILHAFEAAEMEADAAERRAWLTFVVIGGGPTRCVTISAVSIRPMRRFF